MTWDVIVIGGGISGAGAAMSLVRPEGGGRPLRTLILEAESSPGYHSTGRSAALYTPHYGPPAVRRLSAASLPFLAAPPDWFAAIDLLHTRGALTVALPGLEAELEERLALSTPGAEVLPMAAAEAHARAPFLRRDRIGAAAWEPGVADIDVARLHQGFLAAFKAAGGEVATRQRVERIERRGAAWHVITGRGSFEAAQLVNAAGAWAAEIGALAGAAPLALEPRRRTAILLDPPPGMALTPEMAFVEWTDRPTYIKPEATQLMISPGDATPDTPQDVQPDEMDVAVLADWVGTETAIPVRRIAHAWAGLRTFAADGLPVMGLDTQVPGFVWLAAQGGYGIMMAPVLGAAAAALCRTGEAGPALSAAGVAADLIAPARLLAPA